MKKPDLLYTTYIRTTPEKLWTAITNPEFTRQYWGTNVSTWAPGSVWEHHSGDGTGPVRVTGRVLECEPPKRLVITWADPEDLQDVSRVTFEIEPVNDAVCLTVLHGDFTEDSVMGGKVSQGWPSVLSSLKSFLETGTPLNLGCCKG